MNVPDALDAWRLAAEAANAAQEELARALDDYGDGSGRQPTSLQIERVFELQRIVTARLADVAIANDLSRRSAGRA